ncbi:Protein of unknown function [Gryllus bimaculatus]|nr:Protein of unknown function [Gryllus bimaculatus]
MDSSSAGLRVELLLGRHSINKKPI